MATIAGKAGALISTSGPVAPARLRMTLSISNTELELAKRIGVESCGSRIVLPCRITCEPQVSSGFHAPAPTAGRTARRNAFEPIDVLLRMPKYEQWPILMSASVELRKRLS